MRRSLALIPGVLLLAGTTLTACGHDERPVVVNTPAPQPTVVAPPPSNSPAPLVVAPPP